MEDVYQWAEGLRGTYALPPGLLASFFDAVPASVAILDRAANIVAVNAAWKRFSARHGGTVNDWSGLNYLTVMDAALEDPDVQAITGGLRSVLHGGLSSFDHEYPSQSPGERRWFRCLVMPLTMMADGPVAGAAVMHVDVTAQHRAEDHAIAANRAKSDFLANMSHELRTPLNAVIGFSEMLMMEFWGPLNDRYKTYAADINHAGKHLLSIINEILDLSKVEAGKLELQAEPVDLKELVAKCLHLVAGRASQAQVEVTAELPARLSPLVADPRLLRQIVLNLLSNAVKFTPPGGRVTATVKSQGTRVTIAVADTGIGIAPEHIALVLEPFGQVDSQQARLYQGESTGLGLPLVKRFAELHGGRLELTSVPGQGTTAAVHLPRKRCTD
jgi:signal transduction histidine kinase